MAVIRDIVLGPSKPKAAPAPAAVSPMQWVNQIAPTPQTPVPKVPSWYSAQATDPNRSIRNPQRTPTSPVPVRSSPMPERSVTQPPSMVRSASDFNPLTRRTTNPFAFVNSFNQMYSDYRLPYRNQHNLPDTYLGQLRRRSKQIDDAFRKQYPSNFTLMPDTLRGQQDRLAEQLTAGGFGSDQEGRTSGWLNDWGDWGWGGGWGGGGWDDYASSIRNWYNGLMNWRI